jgi:hypothetical protein
MTTSAKARAHALGIRVLYSTGTIPHEPKWIHQTMECGHIVAYPPGQTSIVSCPACEGAKQWRPW